MGDGTRLAIAIAFLFAAGVAFFFAFHPYGVDGGSIDSADSAIGWLMQEFQATAGDTNAVPVGQPGAKNGIGNPAQDVQTPNATQPTAGANPDINVPGTGP